MAPAVVQGLWRFVGVLLCTSRGACGCWLSIVMRQRGIQGVSSEALERVDLPGGTNYEREVELVRGEA